MAMRHLANEPLATRSSTVAACHVCGCSGFIDEYEPSWIELGLHLEPRLPRRGYVRPVLFGRVQAFFLNVKPRWRRKRKIAVWLTATFSFAKRARSSDSVMSGRMSSHRPIRYLCPSNA